jgi:hypothetical protein
MQQCDSTALIIQLLGQIIANQRWGISDSVILQAASVTRQPRGSISPAYQSNIRVHTHLFGE